ncbi:MAG: 2-C-methyl-D-erythritol 4-phosphate cytidylyltransferase [Bacteroides sp.]
MKKYILIVAGGKGLRMGGEIPKQFLVLGNCPVLMHTIRAFYEYDSSIHIILVLPSDQQTYWRKLCDSYSFGIPYEMADGGETRFHSVLNGLRLITEDGLVGVHDGVRPFVSREVIAHCFEAAAEKRAVIPVIGIMETVRCLAEGISKTVDRNNYKLVQTPQVFTTSLLKQAYNQTYTPAFTDDASVVEALNVPVCLVEGNRENIKITTPFDIKVANALL